MVVGGGDGDSCGSDSYGSGDGGDGDEDDSDNDDSPLTNPYYVPDIFLCMSH